jgi:hypothetical protein
MEIGDIEKIYNLSRLDKDKKSDLEKALIYDNLNDKQEMDLIGTCYIYSNMVIKSIHKEKYYSYGISYMIEEVKGGKTPLEIVSKIIEDCENYSRNQAVEENLGPMNN